MKNIVISCIFFMLIALVSCGPDKVSDGLFQNIGNSTSKTRFKKEKGELLVDSLYNFKAFSFEYYDNKQKIFGYWGIINDTLYFVNPLINLDDCVVKFPIFDFKAPKEPINVGPVYNCDAIPVMVFSYKIELLKEENGVYHVKHTVNEMHTPVTDYCILIFSREKGIIDFDYFHIKGGFPVPWVLANAPASGVKY